MGQLEDAKEKLKEIPSFLTENEDGTYTLKMKVEELIPDGEIILVEKGGKTIESCSKMAEKIGKDMEILLAKRSCKKPVLTDEDIESLKGSNYLRLKFATMYVYGLNDFL